MSVKLYTPELLGLATELAAYPFDESLKYTAEARSKSCGSTVMAGFDLDDRSAVMRTGLRVSACAMGQAACAIFARHVTGCDHSGIAATKDALAAWLAGNGVLPDWPDISLLAPALDYPARHGAILLPWRAASDALCNTPMRG